MNTAPTLPRRPAGAHAAPAAAQPTGPVAAAAPTTEPTAAPSAATAPAPIAAAVPARTPDPTAAQVIAPTQTTLAPIDRAVLALGTALVAWSRRAERRAAAHPVPVIVAPADATPAHVTSPTSDCTERELHHLRRVAAADRAVIFAQRDLGANRLLR
ncbi:hypothetical protein B7R54_01195 [Subtercola boreus]|uniref:Uncharacterized protein n=1 Tax=Subtercola boreus TaxID=120213 RepID=A0A3E0VEA6_9MICO|nr:hypothetical protein [Subtercola boreus]RFA07985.1 hypothetical protein B7R54_01195 [Subtercola boreus]TQL55151.1 hypothetical protein FB464_2708 [Subtercola boreus]